MWGFCDAISFHRKRSPSLPEGGFDWIRRSGCLLFIRLVFQVFHPVFHPMGIIQRHRCSLHFRPNPSLPPGGRGTACGGRSMRHSTIPLTPFPSPVCAVLLKISPKAGGPLAVEGVCGTENPRSQKSLLENLSQKSPFHFRPPARSIKSPRSALFCCTFPAMCGIIKKITHKETL